jgi:hypothetical protein
MPCHDHAHHGGEEYELRIVALADDHAPAVIRLRHVLKALLRQYGFRCVSVRETTPQLPGVAQGERSTLPSDESTLAGQDAPAGRVGNPGGNP